ncbi:MAG: MucR family transcriptional regulator, partial [Alphaproteobacteria bacterium]
MTGSNEKSPSQDELLRMTTQVVSAYVGNNAVNENQIPDVIQSVYGSLEGLNNGSGTAPTSQK